MNEMWIHAGAGGYNFAVICTGTLCWNVFFLQKKELGIHDFNELDLAIRIQANFTFFQMVLFPFRIILRAIV